MRTLSRRDALKAIGGAALFGTLATALGHAAVVGAESPPGGGVIHGTSGYVVGEHVLAEAKPLPSNVTLNGFQLHGAATEIMQAPAISFNGQHTHRVTLPAMQGHGHALIPAQDYDHSLASIHGGYHRHVLAPTRVLPSLADAGTQAEPPPQE